MILAIEQATLKPFAWGVHDCCLFAADVVLAMTGIDYASGFRGVYNTKAGAMALLGMRTLHDVLKERLGEPIPWQFAQRGDVVLVTVAGAGMVGVCTGSEAAFVMELGITMYPMRVVDHAWRVN